MPDWAADGPELRASLTRVIEEVGRSADAREEPTLASARGWHREMMHGLAVPDIRYVGAFRGEPGLEKVQVRIFSTYGSPAAEEARELRRFETKLQGLVSELDSLIPAGQEPNLDQLAAVVDLCAWSHAEWVRIHPFANGNGRIARLWANSLAMRYGLPPFVRIRPRPNSGYGEAAAKAMQGDWQSTAAVFRQLLDDFLNEV